MSAIFHPSCDAAAARASKARVVTEHPRLVLAATILASSLAFIDGSVVNVGLPAIGQNLRAGAADLQWVINAYLLPLSALLLLGGAAGDRFGRRRLLVIGVGLFAAAFVAVERHRGEGAMMPLALFASASFVGLTLLTLLLYGALGGLLVLIPYVLIQSAGYSATAAGAALLPFPMVIAAASPLMGALAGRLGPRTPLTVGPLVVAGGFLLILRIGPGASYWTSVFPAVIVIAIGMAGAVAPLTTAVLASVDARHTGSASGLNSAVARTGGLVATALLGAVLAARGAALITQFHVAALVGAVTSLGAAASAGLLIGKGERAAAR